MPFQNRSQLSRTTVLFHWIVAVGVIGMLAFGLYVEGMPRGPDKGAAIQIHKSFGIIVLFLVSARLIWRFSEGWPEPPPTLSQIEKRLMRAVHWVLLLGPFVMIASGITASLTYARSVKVFGIPFIPKVMDEKNEVLNEFAGNVHAFTAWCLILALVLHVAGALRHHFIRRDETLMRMLRLPTIPQPQDGGKG